MLQERGFKSISTLKSEMQELIQYHQCEKFYRNLTNSVYILIVHDLYVASKETDVKRSINAPWMRMRVRGKEISISPPKITRLRLPQFPTAKYEIKIKPIKIRKEKELKEVEDTKEDLKVEPEGETNKADEASDPDFNNFKHFH
ncbi:hypothetical protein Gorai_013296 [Gossypium raimondii]|uniref:Uncharacterized protein n=1 Tax=Gossypium raimondii TaxID=29730 RepID=A0A7J8Q4W3_GOSRA|nr:hypothetical protein [Gossypium raimondii]